MANLKRGETALNVDRSVCFRCEDPVLGEGWYWAGFGTTIVLHRACAKHLAQVILLDLRGVVG